MAGPRLWGGKRQKTPSRSSSNPCLWFVASSLSSLSPAGFPPFFISSCLSSLSPISVTPPVSKSLPFGFSPSPSNFSDSSFCQHLCPSVSPCPSPSVCLSPSVCVGVSVHLFHHPSVWLSALVLLRVPTHSPRHSLPGQQRPLLAPRVGRGYRAAASGRFTSSWAEQGVRGRPAVEAASPLGSQAKDPRTEGGEKAGPQCS